MNSIQFTAIPNGIVSADASGTVVSLSVYVTPQLTDPTLATVQAFLNWPSFWPSGAGNEQAPAFNVQFAGGPLVAASLDPAHATNRFDSGLWQALFSASTTVNAWSPASYKNYASAGVLSYGAQNISTAVKGAYRYAAPLATGATISSAPASNDALSHYTAGIANVLPAGSQVGAAVASTAGTSQALSQNAPAAVALKGSSTLYDASNTAEFARAAAFHNRSNYRNLSPSGTAGATTVPPTPDFHQILGHLADHPAILRRLGLIIDLTFILPAVGGTQSISVSPLAALPGFPAAQIYTPWTKAVVQPYGGPGGNPAAFRPYYQDVDSLGAGTPATGALVDTNGQLRIDDPSVLYLDDLDIDHAAVNVSNFAESATNDLASSGQASVPVKLPALRTTGFALHHQDREGVLGTRFTTTALWNPSATSFVGEDLVRGYRPDVRTVTIDPNTQAVTATGDWKSLCYRNTTFTFPTTPSFPNGTVTIPPPDEGYVKAASMSQASTATPVYNLNESLFHWDGWSVVVGRPGLSVGTQSAAPGDAGGAGTLPSDGPVPPASNGSGAGVSFSSTIAPQPGTLPRLRFGTWYQMRVRAVNLVGGDMQAAAAGPISDHVTPPRKFTRYEPVSPPVLQLRRAVTEGESVERLVIRSDPYNRTQIGTYPNGLPMYAPAPVHATAWAANNTGQGMNAYAGTSERHIAPPKTSVHMAEYHSAIDNALAGITAAPPGSVPVSSIMNDPRTIAAWAIVSKEDGTFYDTHVTDSTTGQYHSVLQPNRAIVTPPSAALDAVYTGTQGIPRGTALASGQYVTFDTPNVVLPYLPDPNARGIALTQPGPQGQAPLSVSLRSFAGRPGATNPAGQAWPELAPFRLVLNDANENAGGPIAGLDVSGPAATDPITVSLPPATVMQLNYSSTINDPTVHAFGPATAADPSYASAQSGQLPVLSPSRQVTLVHAVQRPVAPNQVENDVAIVPRAPGDTSASVDALLRFDGATSGRVDLVASWNEYIDQPMPNAYTNGAVVDPSANPIAHSGVIVTVTPDVTATTYTNPTPVVQLFGDTKRRDLTYTTIATTRFREYFPTTITNTTTNITSSSVLPSVPCPSTARPPVPKVLYVVPSFTFTPSANGTTTTSTRSGGTVRVYVDRGWFASGADERLAVICATSSAQAQTIPQLVSQWGTDPIWYRGALNSAESLNGQAGYLDAMNHIGAAGLGGPIKTAQLAEGGVTVNVATYKPSFNLQRQLWYFDIALTTDQAYFPFLRLALARYQPESVNGLNLSRVVCAEFTQLSATRTATVVSAGAGSYNVSLTGVTAPNSPSLGATPAAVASGHTVTAEFQEAIPATAGATPDDILWTTIGTVTTLSPGAVSGVNVTYQPIVNGAVVPMVFPSGAAPAGSQHRILFKEYEVYAADPDVALGTGLVQLGEPVTPYLTRLVYMDTVPIA